MNNRCYGSLGQINPVVFSVGLICFGAGLFLGFVIYAEALRNFTGIFSFFIPLSVLIPTFAGLGIGIFIAGKIQEHADGDGQWPSFYCLNVFGETSENCPVVTNKKLFDSRPVFTYL